MSEGRHSASFHSAKVVLYYLRCRLESGMGDSLQDTRDGGNNEKNFMCDIKSAYAFQLGRM